MSRPVYVEIDIGAPLAAVWDRTQSPEQHERWDLRFTRIEYLPRTDPDEPQQFRYATRLGFGLGIEGRGETVGERVTRGVSASALRFWSDDPRSLIREGSGYWRYTDGDDRVRLATRYDYRVRYGAVGRLIDRALFRPLMTWATAWSFDRLRLWIESGRSPDDSLRRFVAYGLARVAVAFVWLWQGAVPKLFGPHADEVAMLADAGFAASTAASVVTWVGLAEVAVGLWILAVWRSRIPLWFTLIAMVVATLAVVLHSPHHLLAAFNPVTLNAQLFVLAAVALVLGRELPSATTCRLSPPPKRCTV